MALDAIVVGGGVVGASLAYHLAKLGLSTRLIDKHHEGRATDAGAGILSPETSGRNIEDWYRFGVTCVGYYSELIPNLESEQDSDTGYAMCGLLRVAVSDDEVEPFHKAQALAFTRQEANQHPPKDELYTITSDEARALFPALAPSLGAFYHKTGARVDGRLLCQALINAGVHYRLDVQHAMVDSLIIDGNTITGVMVDGEPVYADKVAIAGGAWSPTFEEQLGVSIPVEPQRGQIIHLRLRDTDTSNWPVINGFRGHYMVTWDDGRIVVGATRETGSGFTLGTSASGIREVLDEALRVAPGLAEAELLEVRVGLRPYTTDILPVLGAVPNIGNIYLATGHGPTGLQLGPYSGKVVADMIAGRPISDDLEPFHISRFTQE
jgi:D-amino-acid dehydrogenase